MFGLPLCIFNSTLKLLFIRLGAFFGFPRPLASCFILSVGVPLNTVMFITHIVAMFVPTSAFTIHVVFPLTLLKIAFVLTALALDSFFATFIVVPHPVGAKLLLLVG